MKFLLLGKGKTTKAIAKFLAFKNQEYQFACNNFEKTENDLEFDDTLLNFHDFQYVIKSPGISQKHPVFKKIAKKFSVISELDLFTLFNIQIKMIAITGTNGKTTCVTLIDKLLHNTKLNVQLCGNSHQPIFDYYEQFEHLDYLIVELSSFQLENLKWYHPFISCILNLDENHLDSVASLKAYYHSKMNIYKYCHSSDYFIYNPKIKQIKANKIQATIKKLDHTLFYKIDIPKAIYAYQIQMLVLYEICKILNIEMSVFLKTIQEFEPLPYRQQVRKVNDITFINDSKSTSVAATIFAFNQIEDDQCVLLIVGGKDKCLHYKQLKKLPYYRLIAYGEIKDHFAQKIKNCIIFETLDNAFKYATSLQINHKVILFSPATSSFDQYDSYQSRGKHFDTLIDRYQKEHHEEKN